MSQTIHIRNKGKNDNRKFGYFKLDEFKISGNASEMQLDSRLITIINFVRFKFENPVRINSAGRTPEYNSKVGGADNSYHLITSKRPVMALDSSPVNGDFKAYKRVILDNIATLKSLGVMHVGIYDVEKFIHLDVGGTAFGCWGGSEKERELLVKTPASNAGLWKLASNLFVDASQFGLFNLVELS